MFDQIVANVCTIMALQSGCQETFKAAGAQTKVSKDIDDTESYYTKHLTQDVYDLLGKKTVEYTVGAGFVANSIITRTVQLETPFKPFADNLKFQGSNPVNAPPNYNVTLNWKWTLP